MSARANKPDEGLGRDREPISGTQPITRSYDLSKAIHAGLAKLFPPNSEEPTSVGLDRPLSRENDARVVASDSERTEVSVLADNGIEARGAVIARKKAVSTVGLALSPGSEHVTFALSKIPNHRESGSNVPVNRAKTFEGIITRSTSTDEMAKEAVEKSWNPSEGFIGRLTKDTFEFSYIGGGINCLCISPRHPGFTSATPNFSASMKKSDFSIQSGKMGVTSGDVIFAFNNNTALDLRSFFEQQDSDQPVSSRRYFSLDESAGTLDLDSGQRVVVGNSEAVVVMKWKELFRVHKQGQTLKYTEVLVDVIRELLNRGNSIEKISNELRLLLEKVKRHSSQPQQNDAGFILLQIPQDKVSAP